MKTTYDKFKSDLIRLIDFPHCRYDLLYALVFSDGEIIISPFNKTFPDREHYDRYLFTWIIDCSDLTYYDEILDESFFGIYESISYDFDHIIF